MSNISIRKAEKEDMKGVHALIYELGVYEKLAHEVKTSPEILEKDGFGERPLFECFLAENDSKQIVGIALFYIGYSTWKGKMMYLDDLVVTEAYRRHGIGQLLFDQLVAYALVHEIQELRWHVLDWNEPAIKFYKKIDASLDPTWITCKLDLRKLMAY